MIFIGFTLLTACASTAVTPVKPDNPPTIVVPPTQNIENLPTGASSSEVPSVESPAEIPLSPAEYTIQEYPVPVGSHPHDVAPAPDGMVWYTAQRLGELGRLDPLTGETHHIPLGSDSAPHGVIVGPDGAAWVTDGGQNAIVRVDPQTEGVKVFPLPDDSGYTNLNTAVFDPDGILWFTGQSGIYGRLDPSTEELRVFSAPRGRGPYGITVTPDGVVYYASLAGSYVGRIDAAMDQATVLEPPTPGQGSRRVWSDSKGRVWVSEWNAGQVAVYDPVESSWREWKLPGNRPQAYAVCVDEGDVIWLSDFGGNAIVRFDPEIEGFTVYQLPSSNAQVRQILGRPGEIWGAESGTDKLVVIRTGIPWSNQKLMNFEDLFHIIVDSARKLFGKQTFFRLQNAPDDFNAVLEGKYPVHAEIDKDILRPADGGTSFY
jgi:virginiamycin B lyase